MVIDTSERKTRRMRHGDGARPDRTSDRYRFWRASLIGAGIAFGLFMAMLLASGADLRGTSWTGEFYAAQMRALFHGHWWITQGVLGIEGFRHDGHWYMYYGPFPALLRIPVVLLAPGLGSQLTQVSMASAWVVAVVASIDLGWRTRTIIRPNAPMRTAECWVVGAAALVIGAGSVLMFLASQAWIYHEAEMWGCALAIAAFDVLVAYLVSRRARTLVIASGLATFAVCSRASVGLGPILAIGLLAVALIGPATAGWCGLSETRKGRARELIALAVAAIVPIAIYVYTNYSKFGTLFVFPTDQQLMSLINPNRRHFLAESGGTYFGTQFIPTTLLAYLRPWGLGFRSLVPGITFGSPPAVIGGATFDVIEPTVSVPVSMPALTLFACIGCIGVIWPHSRSRRLALFRAPLLGAVAGAVSVFPFGYIAQRYLSDLLPFLIISGLVGLQLVLRWSAGARKVGNARIAWAAVAVLAACSLVVNAALAVEYHWLSPWNVEQQIASMVRFQYAVHSAVPGGRAPDVRRVERLPFPPAPRGSVYVVGKCAGVYWSGGNQPSLAWSPWQGVDRSAASGLYHLKVTLPTVTTPRAEPLVVRGERGSLQTIAALLDRGGLTRFGFASEGHDDLPRGRRTPDGFVAGRAYHLQPGHSYDLEVVMDPFSGHVRVDLDGTSVFRFYQFELKPEQLLRYVFPTDRVAFGRNPGGAPTTAAFTGQMEVLRVPRPTICEDLLP